MGPAEENDLKYVLVIKDEISSYSWLSSCVSSDRKVAKSAVLKLIACFGCMGWLVTDHGSHF